MTERQKRRDQCLLWQVTHYLNISGFSQKGRPECLFLTGDRRITMTPTKKQQEMKEIQTTHNRQKTVSSDEYYTPVEFIRCLGHFDLDPASSPNPRWRTADVMLTQDDDGLKHQWHGRVWLNPPYSAPLIGQFIERMAQHRNGLALVVPKFGSVMFRRWVFPYCDALYLLDRRIRFYNSEWVQMKDPVCQSLLIAYGQENVQAIRESGLQGTFLFPERQLAK